MVIPGTVSELCRKISVNYMALCRPLPYGLHATPLEKGRRNPRKGYGSLPRARAGRRRDVGPVERVSSINSDPVRPSPPLCSHPGHYSAILGAVGARDDKTSPSPSMYILRPSVSYTLEPAYGRRLKRKAPMPLPSNHSWTSTRLTAMSRQRQDST
jgi:hypothetical protein